jgi:hypothetical protein
MPESNNTPPRSRAALALALTVPAPTLGVLAAAYIWPESMLGQLVFAFCKVWLLVMPIVWLVLIDKQRPKLPALGSSGMPAAVLTGSGMFVAIVVGYQLFGSWIDTGELVRQIEAVGLGVPAIYLAGAVYWCTLNSILEEYVWRWFVFTRCEALMPRVLAAIAAGGLFAIHHAVALVYYFDWRVAVLGTVGVFVGGTIWSWIYLRWRNIYAAYVSHVFADIAVFGVGWQLAFGGAAA